MLTRIDLAEEERSSRTRPRTVTLPLKLKPQLGPKDWPRQ